MTYSPIEDLLRNYINEFLDENVLHVDTVQKYPEEVWESFCEFTHGCLGENFAIANLIRNIAKEYDRKQKIKCQFCRIDAGFEVSTPVRPENLCKLHRQDYELNFHDLTLTQPHLKYRLNGEEGLSTR